MISPDADAAVRPDFDPRTGTHTVDHDCDSAWDASMTLIHSLSSLTDDDPMEMRPLGYTVDPDVLDAHARSGNEDATLSFEFHGHRVTVRGDGQIEFAPLQDADDCSPAVRV
jgi:hypothetical protein